MANKKTEAPKLRTEWDMDTGQFATGDYPKTKIKYKLNKDEDGLEEDGVENFYEQIQSHARDTDFETIINQIQNGLMQPNARKGEYGDFTNAPKDFAELQSKIKKELEENAKKLEEKTKESKENDDRSNRKPGGKPNKPDSGADAQRSASDTSAADTKGKTAPSGADKVEKQGA